MRLTSEQRRVLRLVVDRTRLGLGTFPVAGEPTAGQAREVTLTALRLRGLVHMTVSPSVACWATEAGVAAVEAPNPHRYEGSDW